MTTSTLSEGPDIGVAPRSGSLRLLVEGWRFRPHSYALVNQQQCLELIKRPGVELRHRDAPMLPFLGEANVYGLLPAADEAALKAIPPDRGGIAYDAVYRIGFPFDFTPGPAPTFVFATCERMLLTREEWTGPGDSPGEAVERADLTIVTPSEWSRAGLVRSGISPDRVVVVPHGVDTALFRPLDAGDRTKARRDTGIAGRFVFLNVSALTGNKNVGAVVEAFGRVVQKHPHAMLVLKGLDAVYGSDKWLQVELGSVDAYTRWKAGKNMSYIGATVAGEGMARIFQTADCYVSPYKSEAFNLPVLEAMACGLRCIVPDGGCTDDFLHPGCKVPVPASIADHDGDGFQWIKTTVDDIAAAMERAITDPDNPARSLHAGPLHAQRYTWHAAVDRLLAVLSGALKGTR